jgi:hypothetical protein
MTLGTYMIGEEGQAVWRIKASPISAKNLVKSKFATIIVFSLLILLITGLLGAVLLQLTLNMVLVGFLEGIFLTFTFGSVSLYLGFKGADFTETPRPKIIRQSWAMINWVFVYF